MALINNLFREIRFELLKVIVLNSFLDATILFLALLLVLSVFSINIAWSLAAAIIFFCFRAWRYSKQLSLNYIEERNPTVHEMLRTAADNNGADTLMAHALFADVIERVRQISSGTFLDFKKLFLKIGAVFVLSAILISLAFFNINIQKFQDPLQGVENTLGNYWGGILGEPNNTKVNITDAGNIYGAPSIAKLGNQALNVTLQQSLSQIDFTKVSDAQQNQNTPPDYPTGNVSATASQAYTGGLQDVNDRKAAADYSQQIKGG